MTITNAIGNFVKPYLDEIKVEILFEPEEFKFKLALDKLANEYGSKITISEKIVFGHHYKDQKEIKKLSCVAIEPCPISMLDKLRKLAIDMDIIREPDIAPSISFWVDTSVEVEISGMKASDEITLGYEEGIFMRVEPQSPP